MADNTQDEKKVNEEKIDIIKEEYIKKDDISKEKHENKDKKKSTSEKSFKLLEVVIITIISLSLGLFVGSLFLKQKPSTIYNTNNKYLDEFLSTLNTIKENSYSNVTDEVLFESAIKGMLGALGDNYADYFNPNETDNFEIKMTGSYIGAGCEISMLNTGEIVILTVYDNSPASDAGLKYGDIVLEIDGMSVKDWTSDQLSNYIRTGGKVGTTISIKVKREEKEITLPLKRGHVTLTSAYGHTIKRGDKTIGYIKVDLFALNTYTQFKDALEILEKEKIDSLIIDVRDNSGGYLSVATSMISLFLGRDKVIYQLQDKDDVTKVYSTSKESRKYDIAVLINENSASASEILAAALKESYGATLIGKTTYGKGTVQETNKLSNGNMIKYTIQNWLTPKGTWIEGKGYAPDIVVEDEESMIDKAVETLIK